jgi:hypothetical protein
LPCIFIRTEKRSQKPCPDGLSNSYYAEEIAVQNSRRQSYGGVAIIFGVEKTPLPEISSIVEIFCVLNSVNSCK